MSNKPEEKVDKIRIENALENPLWRMVWAAEPEREIDVRMSYEFLRAICDFIIKIRRENECNRSK